VLLTAPQARLLQLLLLAAARKQSRQVELCLVLHLLLVAHLQSACGMRP
jgi:hypothetical protein